MSIEIHVFFHGEPPTKAALQRQLKAFAFPFSLRPATGSLRQQSGYMPMRFDGDDTGVELDLLSDQETILELLDGDNPSSFAWVASFRWGGDETEMTAGFCTAAALAALTGGVMLDGETGEFQNAEETATTARQIFASIVASRAKSPKLRGTRPADIKYYLKPLLAMRDDLALVDRLLFVRPVRHILRGAFFDRTSSRYGFDIWRYLKPLHDGASGLRFGDHLLGLWRTFERQFPERLIDAVNADILSSLGAITSFDDIAREFANRNNDFSSQMIALVLAGRRAEALEIIDHAMHRPDWKHRQGGFRKIREQFERDIKTICDEMRELEAKTVKALKIERYWEPSPFPAEIADEAQRRSTHEPLFLTEPWPARPANLLGEVPAQVGEVLFGDEIIRRRGWPIILRPIDHVEAKRRHEDGEPYALAQRLSDGALLTIRDHTGYQANDPSKPELAHGPSSRSFQFYLDRDGRTIDARFWGNRSDPAQIELQSLDVRVSDPWRNLLYAYNDCHEATVCIHRTVTCDEPVVRWTMTDADLALCRFPAPAFGETTDLLDRVRTYLARAGVDPFADDLKLRDRV